MQRVSLKGRTSTKLVSLDKKVAQLNYSIEQYVYLALQDNVHLCFQGNHLLWTCDGVFLYIYLSCYTFTLCIHVFIFV